MFFKRTPSTDNRTLAAVDLGSNSFHLIVAQVTDQDVRLQDRLKEMVRLGAGLDDDGNLSQDAQDRALACLERFGQRLRNIPDENVRIVGTNTLRKAKNSQQFIAAAEEALGHSVEVISGIEEARLIFLGVAHSLAENGFRRLVIDIGGGSTEAIIGQKFKPEKMTSLYMGCVSMSRQFFADGYITKERLQQADTAARLELEGIAHQYIKAGWDQAVGASGSVRSIAKVVLAQEWSDQGITRKSLKQLRKALLNAGHIDKINLTGLVDERRPVFVGGFVVLQAIFDALQIDNMLVSDGAVREGLIFELLGRIKHEDVRERTVSNLIQRYTIDDTHAGFVEQAACQLFDKVAVAWGIDDERFRMLLSWAARLHEIGMSIAHAGYQKHSAYLILNSDLPGFTLHEQKFIATLVRYHRRKLPKDAFNDLPKSLTAAALQLCILLRIAVKLQRSRLHTTLPDFKANASVDRLTLKFPADWLAEHALTITDLARETDFLDTLGFELTINGG